MTQQFYFYSNEQGEKTNNIKEVVTQEVEVLAYQFIEKFGKRPEQKQIDTWIEVSLERMGWYDNE